MSNDDDKTVFSPNQRKPGATQQDSTLFIPQPGGQRRPPPPPQPAMQTAAVAPAPPIHFDGDRVTVQRGLNPLISAAATLLAVMTKLRNTPHHQDVAGLHRHLVDEIKQFDATMKAQNARPEIALAARYQICSSLDETVMNTPWGAQAGWAQRSLLSLFHKETSGGEKFFAILAKMMENPGTNLELIELDYLLLSLGFEGKFRIDPRGRDQLEVLRDNLYHTIEKLRGEFPQDLSPRAASTVRTKKALVEFIPLWVIAAFFAAAIVLVYAGFRVWIFQDTQPTAEQLNTLQQKIIQPNAP